MQLAKVIAICNHKGGVGKTTTAENLAAGLTRKGYKVLAIDLDAQESLTFSLSGETYEKTIADTILNGEALPIAKTATGIDLVPGSFMLSTANNITNQETLKKALAPVRLQYDYVVIDCAPGVTPLTVSAIKAATDVIITLTADAMALHGAESMREILDISGGNLTGYVITKYTRRRISNAVISQLRSQYGGKVFNTLIRENIALTEAQVFRTDVFTYAPGSNGAADYMALTEEIIKRTN